MRDGNDKSGGRKEQLRKGRVSVDVKLISSLSSNYTKLINSIRTFFFGAGKALPPLLLTNNCLPSTSSYCFPLNYLLSVCDISSNINKMSILDIILHKIIKNFLLQNQCNNKT